MPIHIDDVLYIIGNGFDLHHSVKSAFNDFRKWMMKHDRKTYIYYEQLCQYDKIWSDFETSMAHVSRDALLEMGHMMIPDKDFDEWSGAEFAMISDYPTGEIDCILTSLRRDLHKWICSVQRPHDYAGHKLLIDYNARFLTFNYSTFLETEYGIEPERVMHIHGKKSDRYGSLVIGHGEDLEELFDMWKRNKKYDKLYTNNKGRKYRKRDFAYKCLLDPHLSLLPEHEALAAAVEGYYRNARKDTAQIIKDHTAYFDDLYDIRHIYVWGFSFAKVDMPYLQRILLANDKPKELKWHVSYYSPPEIHTFEERLSKIGVDTSNMAFHRLTEMQML